MITASHIQNGFKFMIDDYEYTVHKLNSDVMYLSLRLHFEGHWVNLNERPNINVNKDHLEIFSMVGSTILRGRFYYSVMSEVTQSQTITA